METTNHRVYSYHIIIVTAILKYYSCLSLCWSLAINSSISRSSPMMHKELNKSLYHSANKYCDNYFNADFFYNPMPLKKLFQSEIYKLHERLKEPITQKVAATCSIWYGNISFCLWFTYSSFYLWISLSFTRLSWEKEPGRRFRGPSAGSIESPNIFLSLKLPGKVHGLLLSLV